MPLLTVRAIETHKAEARPYKLTLDRGLQLRIAPDGVRTLLVRYTVKGSDVERQHRLPQEYGEGPGQMRLVPATTKARYGLTWDDVSTKQDRDFWIAGGELRIIDLETNQIIAERRGYMMDPAQGNQIGGRSPWAFAYDNACPSLPKVTDGRAIRVGHTKKFVLTAVKPK
jgi:hypothetical protein